MVLVDTSVWVEFLKRKPPYFNRMRSLLDHGEVLGIECVFGELLQGARGDAEANIILEYWDNISRVSDSGLWLEAGVYSSQHKLFSKGVGLIDAVLIVAAKKARAKLWTLDLHLSSVAGQVI